MSLQGASVRWWRWRHRVGHYGFARRRCATGPDGIAANGGRGRGGRAGDVAAGNGSKRALKGMRRKLVRGNGAVHAWLCEDRQVRGADAVWSRAMAGGWVRRLSGHHNTAQRGRLRASRTAQRGQLRVTTARVTCKARLRRVRVWESGVGRLARRRAGSHSRAPRAEQSSGCWHVKTAPALAHRGRA